MARKDPYVNGVAELVLHQDDYRIRLPGEVARNWGAAAHQEEQFQCEGYFRTPGELHCLPAWALGDSDEHPFRDLQGYEVEPSERLDPFQIPSAQLLFARARFWKFTAKWTGGRKQLDLNVGRRPCQLLIGGKTEESLIHLLSWGSVLVIVAQYKFEALMHDPLPKRLDV